jgi:hypothetical protein
MFKKNILEVGKGSKHTYEDTKAFLNGSKEGFSVDFSQFQCSVSGYAFPMRIRIQDSHINARLCESESPTLGKCHKWRQYGPYRYGTDIKHVGTKGIAPSLYKNRQVHYPRVPFFLLPSYQDRKALWLCVHLLR